MNCVTVTSNNLQAGVRPWRLSGELAARAADAGSIRDPRSGASPVPWGHEARAASAEPELQSQRPTNTQPRVHALLQDRAPQ